MTTYLAAAVTETAVMPEGSTFDATFARVDSDLNVHLKTSDRLQVIPVRQLTRWGRYADQARSSYVWLADKSVLVADLLWIGEDRIAMEANLWGRIVLPRDQVRAVVLAPPGEPLQRDLLFRQIEQAAGLDDQLLLTNGDRLSGQALAPADQAASSPRLLRVVRGPGERALNTTVENVASIVFAPALLEAALLPAQGMYLGLRDGTLLLVERLGTTESAVELQLTGGLRLRSESSELWPVVQFIQPFSSAWTYLSELEPSSYRHIPFLSLRRSWTRDRSVLGGRLRSQNSILLKGIGMPSSSRLTYELAGRYRTFVAELALDQQAGVGGSVTFQVFCQGRSEAGPTSWRQAYASPIVRGGDDPLPIAVDVSHAHRLALIVGFGERGEQRDYANWLHARLVPLAE